jgi:hypothetical protein
MSELFAARLRPFGLMSQGDGPALDRGTLVWTGVGQIMTQMWEIGIQFRVLSRAITIKKFARFRVFEASDHRSK